MTNKSEIVKQYKDTLPMHLRNKYDEISEERKKIGFQGYGLGILISLFIIFYNLKIKGQRLGTFPLVCTVVATAFITNYFYYILSPKSDWMINHLKDEAEIKAWLVMYREMQFNYHMGLVFGIIATGILAFAFRC